MAASFGGIKALGEILGELPADFPAPIAIVQHRSSEPPNMLARVIGRHTLLKVKTAEEGETMRPGTVYLAPPDLHLQIQDGGVCHLSDGRKIRHLRSSANPLFDSASDGVQAVKERGGMVIAQDEATSAAFGMPRPERRTRPPGIPQEARHLTPDSRNYWQSSAGFTNVPPEEYTPLTPIEGTWL